jgi:integrase
LNLAFPTAAGHVESHDNIINRALIPAWEAAGVVGRYTGLHALRHYFVSWCLARPPVGLGLSLKESSERAGHANIAITADTYGHLLPRDDEAAALASAEGKFG